MNKPEKNYHDYNDILEQTLIKTTNIRHKISSFRVAADLAKLNRKIITVLKLHRR